MIERLRTNRFMLLGGFAGLVLLAAFASGFAVRMGYDLDWMLAGLKSLMLALEAKPELLYLGTAFLPGVGFPLTPFMVAGGVVYGRDFGTFGAILITQSAILICMVWSYFVAAYPFRRLIESIIRAFGFAMPALTRTGYIQAIFLVRATPGIPFQVQNFSLGVTRAPFWLYLLISTPVSVCYTSGFVISGTAILEGNVLRIVYGVVIIVLVSAVVRYVYRRAQPSRPETETHGASDPESNTSTRPSDEEGDTEPDTGPTGAHESQSEIG